jgi:hypothetical protein
MGILESTQREKKRRRRDGWANKEARARVYIADKQEAVT